jgi:hypothetical protein
MAGPSSLTLDYDALLSTTLFNYHRTLVDNISRSNAVMHFLMKRNEGGYQRVDSIGDRMQVPLMYEMGQADSYSGYDVLDTTPMDGITSAFWEWRQAAVPISISALEVKKNSGEARILDLLKSKTMQAEMGIQDFFNRRLLVGAGGASITSPYTSAMNGSVFIDPLPLLIKGDPTSSTVVGNINQATNPWWQNQFLDGGTTTFALFLKQLRRLRKRCGRGPGGMPDLHLLDEDVHTLYEVALAAAHQNPSYQRADIPFDNIMFYGAPAVYDEIVPDWKTSAETPVNTQGTWVMINSKFFQIQVHAGTDFAPTDFTKPENQDAKTAHILWLGGIGVSNRRKHGVLMTIDTTITS